MRPRAGRLLSPATALAVALAGAAGGRAAAISLTAQERAGKRIFLQGESPSGVEITARIGRDGVELPASSLPCGGCHGEDGLGRAEGGAKPSNITWRELAKPYGHVHEGGRKHPPFDARSFGRAVSQGVDPAGTPLDLAMPRYALSQADLASLVAYLKRVEQDLDPGISPEELRLGTILPTSGPTAHVGLGIRKVLEAEIEALNAGGGIHGRRVRLVVGGYDAAGGAAAALRAARRLVSGGDVLALVSGFFPAAEKEVFALADQEHVPLVGPFTLFAAQADSPSPWVFHLLGGVREQGRVLADFISEKLAAQRPRVAIVHADDPRLADAAIAARDRFGERGFDALDDVPYPRGRVPASLPRDLAAKDVRVVLFLGEDPEAASFLRAAGDASFTPFVLLPGPLGARAAAGAPAAFQGLIFLAYPTVPQDEKPEARARLARIDLPPAVGSIAGPINADAALAVAAEGLRRAGRALSRRALVAGLEGLYRFEPGLLPAMSYGPKRRVGALGAYVLSADLAGRTFRPAGGWRNLE